MVGLGSNLVESMGSQRRDHFRDLEQRRDQEGSLHTTHTSRSHSRGGSHLSYKKNIKAMQLEYWSPKEKFTPWMAKESSLYF